MPRVFEESRRRLRLADQDIDYYLRRSARRTVAVTIDNHGLNISAPLYAPLDEIEALLHKHSRWVLEKLNKRKNRTIPAAPCHGGTLPVLGEPFTLAYIPAQRPRWQFSGVTLELHLPDESHAPAVLKAVFKETGRAFFEQRLHHFAPQLRLRPPPLRITSARSRWGSCSSHGGICLSWRLAMLPPASIDYIICHELAHLKEMNHGPRFWAIVEKICPDWRARRDAMRQQGLLIPDF